MNKRMVGKQRLDKDSFVGREAVNVFSKAFTNLFLKTGLRWVF